MRIMTWQTALVLALLTTISARAEDIPSLLLKIKAIGKEGAGHAEARKAWKELAGKGPEVLPEVLAGLDDASPTSANWIRSAIESISERSLAQGKPIQARKLESFVKETKHSGAARRLAYEYLVRLDPTAPQRLLPGMVNDPGAELRRDAVEVLIKDAQKIQESGDTKAALAAFDKAFFHARDKDQVQHLADQLKKLGKTVDLTQHFGFITRWAIVGPFDNVGGVGFNTTNPPERGVDLKAKYPSKENEPCGWEEVTTGEKLGLVDFNKVVGKLKGATYFAYAQVDSPMQRPVEIRAGSNNAVRIWLNGEQVYFREEYHHGMKMDQHVGKGVLKQGNNEILIKVCQNEQTEDWAQQWSFQLRLCDHLGGAVPFTVVTPKLPARKAEEK
jgi:hypothetical protein